MPFTGPMEPSAFPYCPSFLQNRKRPALPPSELTSLLPRFHFLFDFGVRLVNSSHVTRPCSHSSVAPFSRFRLLGARPWSGCLFHTPIFSPSTNLIEFPKGGFPIVCSLSWSFFPPSVTLSGRRSSLFFLKWFFAAASRFHFQRFSFCLKFGDSPAWSFCKTPP